MIVAIQTRRALGIWAVLAVLGTAVPALAHKATERFIPIGQSPGVSHVLTEVGKLEGVDPRRRSITMATPSGLLVIGIRAETKIWVDRTKSKLTNLNGSFADLKSGRTIEVRFIDPKKKQIAVWVKIEAPPAP